MSRNRISFCTLLLICLFAAHRSAILEASPASLDEFTPVDTSILMGAPEPPLAFELEPAFPYLRFAFPVHLTHAGDGSDRLFVVNQDGYIHVFPNERNVRAKKVFLDMSNTVARQMFEEGLLAVAFHPKYRENGEFFVYYSVQPLATRLSRFRVSKDDPNLADPKSEEVLLDIPQPFWNHNSGSIEFGPDGYLYMALGDGGAADDPHKNSQNGRTLLGSILRIDVDRRDPGKTYAVPRDNPFIDRGDNVRPEIWAVGFRNPWKICFDRETGELWEADVGQDLWEEVNVVVRGGNYGWRLREGRHDLHPNSPSFSDEFVEPVWEYHHSEGRSITGGAVYRGKRLPEIAGHYLCADWVSGNVWSLDRKGKRDADGRKIAKTSLAVTAFGEDEAGEVYIVATDHRAPIPYGDRLDGGLYRLRRVPRGMPYDPATFPRKLSETGLFASVAEHRPAPGLIPYDVNVPLWSDGALKERYLALPERGTVDFSKDGNWAFPVGTVIVKTFLSQPARAGAASHRLETRLMVHNQREWVGYTYVWNDAQTEATLIDGYVQTVHAVRNDSGAPAKQIWHFPSRTECMMCHTDSKNFVLGLNTRQLNRVHTYNGKSENQLRRFARLGLFRTGLPSDPFALDSYPDWRASTANDGNVEVLARAYLDVNCSVCHAPDAAIGDQIDLRFHTPLTKSGVFAADLPASATAQARSAALIPGSSKLSGIVDRMGRRAKGDGPPAPGQMPPIATRFQDQRAIAILKRWIDGMGQAAARGK